MLRLAAWLCLLTHPLLQLVGDLPHSSLVRLDGCLMPLATVQGLPDETIPWSLVNSVWLGRQDKVVSGTSEARTWRHR